MPAGRPSGYSIGIATEICERMAGGQSAREIARSDDMPALSTIFLWLTKHPEFSEQYDKAMIARTQYLAEELLEIADDGTNDWMERKGADGEQSGYQVNGEAIQRSRLRVDTRKWVLSKMQPKRYGDKVTAEVTGKDGEPLEAGVSETARALAFILGQAAREKGSEDDEKSD